jgi:tetratricopeptide (TPR) repeat protein
MLNKHLIFFLFISTSIVSCKSADKLNYKFDPFMAKIDSLDCKELVSKYSKIKQENDTILYYLALSEFNCGDVQNAFVNISKSIKMNESNPFKHYAKSRMLKKVGDFQAALNEMELANRLLPNNYFILITKAELLYYVRDFDSSLELLDIINDQETKSAEVYRIRALVYVQEMKTGKAMDNIVKAISIEPNDFELNYIAGDILVKGKKYKESLEYLNRAIELNNTNSYSYLKRGLSFYYLGEKSKCKDDWDKCLKLGNTEAEKYIKTYLE